MKPLINPGLSSSTHRRHVILGGLAAAFVWHRPAFAQSGYPKTKGILQKSRDSEVHAYRQYAAFTKAAKEEGHPGIAYMFTALATAELIHGQNFEKILARLGVEITPPAELKIQVGSTQNNLIKAATDEIDSVNVFYPGILKELRPEGLQDAITITTYAWETEKQHIDILKSIQTWTPDHLRRLLKGSRTKRGSISFARYAAEPLPSFRKANVPSANSHQRTSAKSNRQFNQPYVPLSARGSFTPEQSRARFDTPPFVRMAPFSRHFPMYFAKDGLK